VGLTRIEVTTSELLNVFFFPIYVLITFVLNENVCYNLSRGNFTVDTLLVCIQRLPAGQQAARAIMKNICEHH